MKKRVGIAIVVVIALLVLAVVVMIWPNRPSGPMPTYQGKTAEYWLTQVFGTNQSQALQAFRVMGTNALPVLLNAFERKDSVRSRFYEKIYPRMPGWMRNHLSKPVPARENWDAAELVLLNLGRSIDLPPQFIRLLSNTNNPARAFALSAIENHLTSRDTNSVPALMSCLADTNTYLRFQAAHALEHLGSSAEAAVPALTALMNDKTMLSTGPSGWDWALEARVAAARAVWRIDGETEGPEKVFREALNATNGHVRGWACIYLDQLHPGDTSLIPQMTAMLQGADQGLQLTAAYMIGTFGPAAKGAVPALRNIISTTRDADLHERARNSLKKIDPDAAREYENK